MFLLKTKRERNSTQNYFSGIRVPKKSIPDKYIQIEQEDKIITGYGFESNQQLTKYVIHNSGGIFPVEDNPRDSLRTDSIKK